MASKVARSNTNPNKSSHVVTQQPSPAVQVQAPAPISTSDIHYPIIPMSDYDQEDNIPKWQKLGLDHFRCNTLFRIMWPLTIQGFQSGELSFEGYIISCASFGGHIALIRDPEYNETSKSAFGEASPKIHIVSCSGKYLSSIPVSNKNLKSIGWTYKDELVVLYDEGKVVIYTVEGVKIHDFNLGNSCEIDGIDDAIIWTHGIAVRTTAKVNQNGSTTCSIVAITSFDTPVPVLLGTITSQGLPTSISLFSSNEDELYTFKNDPSQNDNNEEYSYHSVIDSIPGDGITILVSYSKGHLFEVSLGSVQDVTKFVQPSYVSNNPNASNAVNAAAAANAVANYQSIIKAAYSLDRMYAYIFFQNGKLAIYSADFKELLSTIQTGTTKVPSNIMVMTDTSVLLHYIPIDDDYDNPSNAYYNDIDNGYPYLVLIDDNSDRIIYQYKTDILVIPQMHRAIVLSEEICHSFEVVQMQTKLALGHLLMNSNEDGDDFIAGVENENNNNYHISLMKTPPPSNEVGTLVEAGRANQADSPLSDIFIDRILESLGGEQILAEAIETVLQATLIEQHHNTQRTLLSAASLGRLSVSSEADICFTLFPETCQFLRIANELCSSVVGLPITANMLRESLSIDLILRRLCDQRQYLLAVRIAELIKASVSPIVAHWAYSLIRTAPNSISDLALLAQLQDKFTLAPYLELDSLVTLASNLGRRTLALALLQLYSNPIKEVSKLLSMKEYITAFNRALASLDVDLVQNVILHCRETMQYQSFVQVIMDHPLSIPHYISLLRNSGDIDELKNFYFHAGLTIEAAKLVIEEAYAEPTLPGRMKKLQAARELLLREKEKDIGLLQILDSQLSLLDTEQQLARELSDPTIIDCTTAELIERFISRAQSAKAENIRKTYQFNDKHYSHIEIKTLIQNRAFDQLAQRIGLNNSRKSVPPIGYEPIIEACIAVGAPREASKYIALLSEPAEKMTWYCTISYYREAADVAFKEKDPEALITIRLRSGKNNTVVHNVIDDYLKKLGH